MFERYTEKARRVIFFARYEASQFGSPYIETEHLLPGLLREDKALTNRFLRSHASVESIRKQIEEHTTIREKVSTSVDLPLSNECKRVLAYAAEEAERLGHKHIGTEHLLLGLLREEKCFAAEILQERGLKLVQIREELGRVTQEKVQPQQRQRESSLLAEFSRDLTQAAMDGQLDPLVGRDSELERVIQILCRRTKNNPVLIGEPGVGKTAIVEGLAQRIADGEVPSFLAEKRILGLDLSLIVAGTKYRGQFEERLKTIMKELMENQNSIIFIDELHTLVGAGSAEGSLDAANILKPALSRGEVQCIGATTPAEFRKSIEKDRSLERRFQAVKVPPPNEADAIKIIHGIKDRYEKFHAVSYTDDAVEFAVSHSSRYIPDRFLPDKAIDLIDEAASRQRMQVDSKPEELDEFDRRIIQLKIEQEALKKETDQASKDRLAKLESELADLNEKSSELTARWRAEKDKLGAAQKLKEQLEASRNDLAAAQRRGDYAEAGRLTYGVIPDLERKLSQTEEKGGAALLDEAVTPDHIAQVVSRWTGVPVEKMLEGERAKLLKMEEQLARRVVGQHEAVVAVATAVRRARAGLQDPHRPIGSFMFLGPTGVGKTELTKALASYLFDDETAMVRLDMSEYMEKHSVSRLIGAPPGYVGYEEGGALTEAVRRRPYQVVLFDEIEKAHPDVFNVLLQVLDDGRLTDGQGRTVDFRNVVIIMTSNLGSEFLVMQKEGEDSAAVHDEVMSVVRGHFRPEFLNRIDEIILFHRLARQDMGAIVDIQFGRLGRLLEDRKLTLKLADSGRDWLADKGYDAAYGARPLKRIIQKYVQDPLAEKILAGEVVDGQTIDVSARDGHLTLGGEIVPFPGGGAARPPALALN
jgi:ATP-dependent Clp protease ATP-binding subunit ClpB